MVDSVQIVLLLVIVVLTILLVVLGIQVYFILRDLRKTIVKANKVLDDAGSLADRITGPISSLTTVFTGLKAGSVLAAVKFIHTLLSRDKDEQDTKKHSRE